MWNSPPNKDTVRIRITRDCNQHCVYCCDRDPAHNKDFTPLTYGEMLDEIRKHPTIVLTGGEPLLRLDRIKTICEHKRPGQRIILQTNGSLLGPRMFIQLVDWGINNINVSLHVPPLNRESLPQELRHWALDFGKHACYLRMQIQDTHKDWVGEPPAGLPIKYWHMGECVRPNETRITWSEGAESYLAR